MGKFLILYRESDTAASASAIEQRLVRRFGRQRIRVGGDLGARVPDKSAAAVGDPTAKYSVVVVVIGSGWIRGADAIGRRLLDNPTDPVHRTLAAALTAKGVLVLPLLVDGAHMPSTLDLPPDLQPLAYRNAVAVHAGLTFYADMDKAISAIVSFLPFQQRITHPRLAALALVTLALTVIGACDATFLDYPAAHNFALGVFVGVTLGAELLALIVLWWVTLVMMIRMRTWLWLVFHLFFGWSSVTGLLFAVFGTRERAIARVPAQASVAVPAR